MRARWIQRAKIWTCACAPLFRVGEIYAELNVFPMRTDKNDRFNKINFRSKQKIFSTNQFNTFHVHFRGEQRTHATIYAEATAMLNIVTLSLIMSNTRAPRRVASASMTRARVLFASDRTAGPHFLCQKVFRNVYVWVSVAQHSNNVAIGWGSDGCRIHIHEHTTHTKTRDVIISLANNIARFV